MSTWRPPSGSLRGTRAHAHLCSLLLVCCARIGEALHPGPFRIAAINPTGLNTKQDVVAQLPPGIYAVSETHLAKVGIQRFRAGIRLSSSFNFIPGAPAPLRHHSDTSGGYTGVGFLTSYPARPLPFDWPPDIYDTARIQVASFFIEPVWVQGAVLYGYATAKHRTEALMEAALQRIVLQTSGPRFIAGDLNWETHEIPQLDTLRTHGFRDVQDVVALLQNRPPQVTCKGATRKDFIFISPELQEMLISTSVEADWFPDHSLLAADFQHRNAAVARFSWRVPRHRASNHLVHPMHGAPTHSAVEGLNQSGDCPSSEYAQIWASFETRLSQTLLASGGPPLSASERGRATVHDIRVHTAPVVSPPKGRSGEVQPSFFGCRLKHAHWFRQLRRLQALYQALCKGRDSSGAQEYRASLWHAILGAPGFGRPFADWWPCREIKLANDPTAVPAVIPTQQVCHSLFLSFQANVEAYERVLTRTRCREAVLRRKQQPMLIFKDLRAEAPRPVESLVEGPSAVVVDYDPQEAAVTLEADAAFDPAQPALVGHVLCPLVHAEADKLWLDSTEPVQPGTVVTQDRLLGSLTSIFRAFGAEWSQRWQRHAVVPASRWQDAIETAHLSADLPSVSFPPITVQQWRAAVRAKKQRSASGLDGVSRQDLLLMPDDLVIRLLSLYEEAERSGRWPLQAMQAVVSALEKRPDATRVGHYRPITVISLFYRVWSSIRARQCLRYLEQLASPGQFGCLPCRSTSQLWYQLQSQLEQALLSGTTMCGYITDVVKAFNHIPREPTVALGIKLGLPRPVMKAWAGALVSLQRRFKVRQSVGPAIGSVTGLPEGCSMSCVGMAIVNIAYHRHMAHSTPLARALSYVDNFECTASHAPVVVNAARAMQEFAGAWDLSLDPAKSVAWATTAADRSQLRAAGLQVILDGKDLGGHMQYSRRLTNFTQVARLRELDMAWVRLQSSPAPYSQKVSAIAVAAWPKALHAVSLVHLGGQHFDSLRSGAMKGIHAAKPGANPRMHLSLLEFPLADPEFYALWSSLRDFCIHSSPSLAAATLSVLASSEYSRQPGPAGVLLQRLNAVGISWLPEEAAFRDSWGLFNPWGCSLQELLFRAVGTWQVAVGARLQHRKGFSGLDRVDARTTRMLIADYPAESRALLRIVCNGTFYTDDDLHHISETDTPDCPFCGDRDSIDHRLRSCSFFSQERRACPSSVLDRLGDLPPCQVLHAWALLPQSLRELQSSLAELHDNFDVFERCSGQEQVDLFTDGSCMVPTEPYLRLASWAVILASADTQQRPFILASGPIPGLIQSSFRAEIYAVLAALCFAVQYAVPTRVWCDCEGVVSRVSRFIQGSPAP